MASSADGEGWLSVTGLGKQYEEDVWSARGIDLSLRRGEFFGLLGPSGCGKTTTLNMIAGFVPPTEGRIHVGGTDITDRKPYRRGIGMVFQNYALFPHLDVWENVSFGPKRAGFDRDKTRTRVGELLDLVGLASKASKLPAELSGGEQQRVAVARALATNPQLVLLDEPLSNLDAKRREEMRRELRRIFSEAEATVLFVTHDQSEAFAMCDRVAVMMGGRIQQIDAPDRLYHVPRNVEVASFVGEGTFVPGVVTHAYGDTADVHLSAFGGTDLDVTSEGSLKVGQRGSVLLRPESVRIGTPDAALRATVVKREFLGSLVRYELDLAGTQLACVELSGDSLASVGETVGIGWRSRLTFLPGDGPA